MMNDLKLFEYFQLTDKGMFASVSVFARKQMGHTTKTHLSQYILGIYA